MAEEEQHFEEQEQFEGDGMDATDGHEENADVSQLQPLHVNLMSTIGCSLMCLCHALTAVLCVLLTASCWALRAHGTT